MALNIQNLDPATPENAAARGRLGGLAKKGKRHINTWIQELLEDPEFTAKVRFNSELKEFKGAPLKAIIQAQMIKAIEGDTKAFDSLAKYGWPTKSEQEVDVTSKGERVSQPIDADVLTNFLSMAKDQTKQ